MQKAKLVLFDLDGTLMDTVESLAKTGNRMLAALGRSPVALDRYRDLIGSGARDLTRRLLLEEGEAVADDLVDRAYALYLKFFARHATDGVRPYDGMVELVSDLVSAGVKVAVLTNKQHREAPLVIHQGFGEAVFARIWGLDERFPRKPDPASALALAAELGVLPEDTALVGDSDTDVQTAKNAGMKAIAVTWGYRAEDLLLAAEPDLVCRSVSELRAALL